MSSVLLRAMPRRKVIMAPRRRHQHRHGGHRSIVRLLHAARSVVATVAFEVDAAGEGAEVEAEVTMEAAVETETLGPIMVLPKMRRHPREAPISDTWAVPKFPFEAQ